MTKSSRLTKPKRRPVVQVWDGEWITISWSSQHEQCCKCGVRHDVDYRVVDGKLQFRARVLGRKE